MDLLLEVVARKLELIGDATAVQLDLHDVRLLLALLQQLHLGVSDDANHLAVTLHLLEVLLDVFLAHVILPLLGVFREGLLLRLVPVLVESATTVLAQMLGEHGLEGAETLGGLDVANHADNDHRGGLDESHSLHGLLLVQL